MKRTAAEVVAEWRASVVNNDDGELVSRINYWAMTDFWHSLREAALAQMPQGAIELTPINYDPVMARTHLLVPKDMRCHKCGAEEPWKDPLRKEVAETLASLAAVGKYTCGNCGADLSQHPVSASAHICAAPPQAVSGEQAPHDIESLAATFHNIYQAEARRQGDVRHTDAYADLPEKIKEFDRALARYVLLSFEGKR